MNNGTMCGFTRRMLSPGESYPSMKVLYVPGATYWASYQSVDTVHLCTNDSGCTVTIQDDSSIRDGSAMHFVQRDDANQVTLSPGSNVVFLNASSNKTRVQNSVISAMKIDTNLWLIFGDME